MSPDGGSLPSAVKQRFGHLLPGGPRSALAVSGLLLLFYVSSFNYRYSQDSSDLHRSVALNWRALWPLSCSPMASAPTNLSHIVFGIVGSLNTWKGRKAYLESWWRPNVSRGYLFLDGPPENESLLCPFTCPALRINENITHWDIYPKIKYPIQIRMVRSIVEAFRQGDQDIRWFVMADDDSMLFVDNIVEVLSKYDHTKYFYLGASSETILSNAVFTFEMGFGGAGFALSYPLVAAMAKKLDGCIKRYPHSRSADYLTYICILDLGVAISPQKGFHQIDLRGNIAGLLSSHPQSPFLSLHHINIVDPIFPSMNRSESISHLMKSARVDQSRLAQQTICYQREMNWSVSVSWGYSAHIYESILPRYILRKPIETFSPWKEKAKWPMFMFNTRPGNSTNPCEVPHWFFFESIERQNEDDIVTTYSRAAKHGLGPCSLGGSHSADHINRLQVFSPAKTRLEVN
ncbi:hypothetical protein CDL15_Pgr026609 [Punica granatum]|uniref:Uncharacterized protein n=1 Tax=Punica granatum TaxID=22663 RepID=A0A218WMD1_PUNGR|nr:hypothetical protein CDL15_Pgr026609 [Punica granatum]